MKKPKPKRMYLVSRDGRYHCWSLNNTRGDAIRQAEDCTAGDGYQREVWRCTVTPEQCVWKQK